MFRTKLPIETRVEHIFMKTPRHYPIPDEVYNTLDLLGLGEREELLRTLGFAKENLEEHLRELILIESQLRAKPTLKILNNRSKEYLDINDLLFCDIISIWDTEKRVYYFVVSVDKVNSTVRIIKLNQKGMLHGRTNINSQGYSQWLDQSSVYFGRIEKRSVDPLLIGIPQVVINQWSPFNG